MKHKPLASLSLDLDNKWSYMKTHGEAGWESFPSYFDTVVPRVLEFLRQRDLKITFFIVGQDAALDKNHAALKAIAEAGHEIGNHSFNHEQRLHLYPENEIEADLGKAEEHIQRVTGYQPVGFRGPGYSVAESTLNVLKRMGYQYDCSTFPTYLGPLARLYYFMSANLTPAEKRARGQLFGTWADGTRPIGPFRWQLESGDLTEIPVTTMPILRVPIHVSYVLYLSTFSRLLTLTYFRFALLMCRIRRVQPSILLHPLDFMGSDDTGDLAFFPAMRARHEDKLEVVSEVLRLLGKDHRIVTMQEHAQEVARNTELSTVKPRFGAQSGRGATL